MPVGSDGDKEGAPQEEQQAAAHTSLGRLTDPCVWAELKALYTSLPSLGEQGWVNRYRGTCLPGCQGLLL